MLPLGSALKCVEVFPAPPLPDVLYHSLALVEPLEGVLGSSNSRILGSGTGGSGWQ